MDMVLGRLYVAPELSVAMQAVGFKLPPSSLQLHL
eukprot:COSAG06_NODE_30612_length_535_cov_1.708716_1_plen_34_part_01